MNLKRLYLEKNLCYKSGEIIKPAGIMVHSTGANNPNLRRYVPIPTEKINSNNWNQPTPGGRKVCVHAFIGKLADGTIATYQTLPWSMRGWHSGSGSKGSANKNFIGFEICEDGLTDRVYFEKVYKEAVELCIYLCKKFNIKVENIICHSEGYKMGIASNHADVMHWFPRFGKSMDTFRADVQKGLEDEVESMTKEELKEFIEQTVKNMGVGEPVSPWAKDFVDDAKKLGITDGSNPQRLATRQEVMIMAMRAAEKK